MLGITIFMLYVNDACNLREDSIFKVSLDVSCEIVFVSCSRCVTG